MIDGKTTSVKRSRSATWLQLLAFVLLLGSASPALAVNCSDAPYFGLIDGNVFPTPPSQIQIDTICRVQNYPESNPLTTNFSFLTQPGQTDERWIIIFDNVYHTGEMACNAVANHRIWFVNGSSSTIQEGCQNLLIPVEKIDKQNPPGQNTATHGVPFTYRLTMPVLYDPATQTVINQLGSANDLHGVTIQDDLNATGADLTYLSHVAYWKDTQEAVPHSFSNVDGLLTFDNFPIIPAGRQIVIEITVVLEDTPANTPGTQFVNTAKWDFGRLIDGTYYEPLPGEWGISDPMTIVAPVLTLTKTGPATLNLAEPGSFTLDVHNIGDGDAWNVTLRDLLPDGPTGGMCQAAPELLSAQVFAADGVTPVPGKGPLTQGTDFTLAWTPAPTCELRLAALSDAATIGPDEHLLVTYRTLLDAGTQDGVALTNVAGATRWFNGDDSNPDRAAYDRSLTDGTVGTLDHEDAHTVVTELHGNFFEKTVANLSSGDDPTATAAPGDRLRYTLRIVTTGEPLVDARVIDELDALNAGPSFVPGSLSLVSWPAGAVTAGTSATGGARGTGVVEIGNIDLPAFSEAVIRFDVTLAATLNEGYVVANQSALRQADGVLLLPSDDPNVNGPASPLVDGDEDPTRVTILLPDPPAPSKANTQSTASIGEVFTYRLTIPSQPFRFPIYDVKIRDNLSASAADLRFVSVTRISGSQPWTPVNTGTATNLVIEDPTRGIDIPAGEQVVLEIAVLMENTPTNAIGLEFTNSAAYTFDWTNGDPATERAGGVGTTEPMTVVGPDSLVLDKSGPPALNVGETGTFTLDVTNPSSGTAWNLSIADRLPDSAQGGMCDVAPTGWTAQVFEADGTTAVSAPLVPGTDFSVSFSGAPDCTVEVRLLTPATAVGPGQRLILGYQAQLDADTVRDISLTNVAGVTEWFSADPSVAAAADQVLTYSRSLTDGTVGVADHEDAHTLLAGRPSIIFEKEVANVTSGANPAATATPGDRLRYTLRVSNVSDIEVADFALVDELDALNGVPAFEPGSLQLVTVPAGADTSATNPNGGSRGTGLLDIRNLVLGGSGGSVTIEFEVTLAAVLANGSQVANQSSMVVSGVTLARSDDPNVNGPADPDVLGDEDPTVLTVTSAPRFEVQKTSTDLTGDPAVLLAGETLRYTITIRNIGTDNATDAVLRDQVPVNTGYVAGSTTLNGAPVADAAGRSPLVDGMSINSPADPTPGAMPADVTGTLDNVATVTFDVMVDATAADGTIISNQGFVSAPNGGVTAQPSDDPDTAVPDDPTRDIVGALPLLFADKRVELLVDGTSPGVVDPGDTLRYTITVYNNGTVDATGALLRDTVPANTTYVADSTTLNGSPVGQPDGGSSPLANGIDISSSDRTPPLPGAGAGILTAGQSAVLVFDLRVDAGTATGTLISNQAVVETSERPDLLTDGDGNPATGPEPTVVLVGDVQRLAITKEVTVVGGGAATAGATLEYTVRVSNIGSLPAQNVILTDDLSAASPGYLTYVDGTATLDGSPAGVSVSGTQLTADFAVLYGSLAPDASTVLRFRAVINPDLSLGTTVTNTGAVSWNTPAETATASVSIQVGGLPGVGVLAGAAWHDADFDDLQGAGEQPLAGWSVELYQGGRLLFTGLTGADGAYQISGLEPTLDVPYELRFRAPQAGARTALLGMASSPFSNFLQRIADIVIAGGSSLRNLDLPIDPNGVVYDSMTRAPVGGATLTLLDATGGTLPQACFDDPVQQGQVTLPGGYYKFDLNFSDPACPSGGDYLIGIAVPGSGYIDRYSEIIPPTSDATTLPLDVPSCPGGPNDAIPGTTDHCEVQLSELAPPLSVPARSPGTAYHLHLKLDASQPPGSSQLFNNHLPIDPDLSGIVAITKTTPSLNVTRGQLVPYTITVNNSSGFALDGLRIVDRFPAGFVYVDGSARIDGVPTEPAATGIELTWGGLGIPASSSRTLQLLLAVGAGVSEGEYVNRARLENEVTREAISGEATATVRIVPDPTFDCTDVTGKVFNDANRNGLQDPGEGGIAGVRLVTPRGLAATTDAYGRYHITCATVPNELRGSNFVLKLDDRTLPSGFRVAGNALQVKRATRGKALNFDFGASIHRVVALDLADAVFESGTTEIRIQWRPRLNLLLEELQKAPSILRLSYLADVEDEELVTRRMSSVQQQIADAWEALNCCYQLTIEPEVFWRLGGPPGKPDLPMQDAR